MTYKARVRFADLKDGGRIYEAGDEYPRPGFEVTEQRINELAGSDNRMGYALIEAVKPAAKPEPDKSIKPKAKPAKKAVSARNKG